MLISGGCAVGPDFVRPDPPSVGGYLQGGDPVMTIDADGKVQRFVHGEKVAADWWKLFSSPTIDDVMREAAVNNPGVRIAEANLRKSQADLNAGYGVFFPQVGAGGGVVRQRTPPGPAGGIFSLFTLSAVVSYSIDLFGGHRRMVEGLQAEVDLQQAGVDSAYLFLSGNIVNTLIAYAGYNSEVLAVRQIAEMQKEHVRLAEIKYISGVVPYSEVLSLKGQLAATEAVIPAIKQRAAQSGHLLAVLSGHAPAEWSPPEIMFDDISLPESVPLTLTSEFVRRRPDILAAEARLHRTSAHIGVATAAMFPDITLNGTYGTSGSAVSDLLRHKGSFWSVGADIAAPLFRGGALWYQRKAAIEAYEAALEEYRQTVLTAFGQVADLLRALEHDAETLHAQSAALETAEQTLKLVQANYEAGVSDYLQVLITDAQYYQAKIGYIQAKMQRLQDTVGLIVALGGGWQNNTDLVKKAQ